MVWTSLVRSLGRITFVAALSAIVGGCTEERALAVKTAAEVFAQKASAAIDEVVEVYLRAALGKPEAEEDQIKDIKQSLLETQAQQPAALDKVITLKFGSVGERERARSKYFSHYDNLKIAYQEFAAAYRRLPEGSFVAAKDVACSAALAARLTQYMAEAGKAVAQNPPLSAVEAKKSEDALRLALKKKDNAALDEAVRARVALLKDLERANAKAVAMLADAAEAGVETLELLERYDAVSAADLLKAVRGVLLVRESALGLSSKAQIERLDNVVSKLNSKPALAKAMQMPLNQAPADCR